MDPASTPSSADSSALPANARGTGEGAHGRLALVLGVAATIVLADLLTKLAVVVWVENQDPIRVIGEFARINVIRNSGAAFSMGASYTFVFPIIAIVVAVVVIRQARRLTSTAWAITLGALLGGAVGNLVDRLFRDPGFLQGHVVDFVDIGDFPVFNVADSAITLSAVAIVVLTLLGIGLDGKRAHRDEPADG